MDLGTRNFFAMKIEINREYIEQLTKLIEQKADQEIIQSVISLHPADIAEIMEQLDSDEAQYLFLLLDGELASDVLVEIPENDRKRFLIEVMDKNMLYIPLSEIDDETYGISDDDKKLNRQFHGKA